MTKRKRNADGRQSIMSLRGSVLAGFALSKNGRIVALDFHGEPLFMFQPWELIDPQGMFFTVSQVRKEIDL